MSIAVRLFRVQCGNQERTAYGLAAFAFRNADRPEEFGTARLKTQESHDTYDALRNKAPYRLASKYRFGICDPRQ
jgi:hypothetical protein